MVRCCVPEAGAANATKAGVSCATGLCDGADAKAVVGGVGSAGAGVGEAAPPTGVAASVASDVGVGVGVGAPTAGWPVGAAGVAVVIASDGLSKDGEVGAFGSVCGIGAAAGVRIGFGSAKVAGGAGIAGLAGVGATIAPPATDVGSAGEGDGGRDAS